MGLRYLLFTGSVLSLITPVLIYRLNMVNLLVIIVFIVGMALILGSLSKSTQYITVEDEKTRKNYSFHYDEFGNNHYGAFNRIISFDILGSTNNRSPTDRRFPPF